MKEENTFKIGTQGYLTKAFIYLISKHYLIFVEVTEVFKGKPVLVGQYVGIVEMLNDHNLEWVCNYGSKYETRPAMTAWNVREWPIIEVDEPGVLN
jgi:hypothetical protein